MFLQLFFFRNEPVLATVLRFKSDSKTEQTMMCYQLLYFAAAAAAAADDTLWTGAPGSYTDPEAPAALVVVRELVNQERFSDATAAATRLFGGQSEVSAVQFFFFCFPSHC